MVHITCTILVVHLLVVIFVIVALTRYKTQTKYIANSIERKSVTSLYHGSNIFRSQQWGALVTTTATATRTAKKNRSVQSTPFIEDTAGTLSKCPH